MDTSAAIAPIALSALMQALKDYFGLSGRGLQILMVAAGAGLGGGIAYLNDQETLGLMWNTLFGALAPHGIHELLLKEGALLGKARVGAVLKGLGAAALAPFNVTSGK